MWKLFLGLILLVGLLPLYPTEKAFASAPTATITVAKSFLGIGKTSLVTITFSEAVTGFSIAILTVDNGTLSGLSTHDNITWTATLTPVAGVNDATNIITLDNTGVKNIAGNAGIGTTQSNNYSVDMMRPTSSIVVADTALKAGETSQVTITFSEAVTGFSNAILTVEGGTLSAVSSSNGGITWTADLTPAAGIVAANNIIRLDNTGVSDASGNAGTGITQSNNYSVNTVRPTSTIVVADYNLAIGKTSLVTITFSEAVSGFGNADLTVESGMLSAVSSSDGGITWTVTLTPAAGINEATNIITLDNTGVINAAGNAGTGITQSNNYSVNTVRPTSTIVVADNNLGIGKTSQVTITFSEAVTGFSNAILTVYNGTLSGLSTHDNITWTADLTPAAGIVAANNIIRLDNTGVKNIAGNAGIGITQSNNYSVDTVRPTSSIVVADTALKAGETSQVTITFSEAVTGFSNADLTVESGTLSAVSSSNGGITWTATLTPAAGINEAINIITLNNSGVSDAAGNAGAGITQSNNYSVNTVRPTSSIVVADTVLKAGDTSQVTITFSEAVSGFSNAILTVENGTLSAVSSSNGGITWTATFTPTTGINDTTNIIRLDNSGVINAAGNAGTGITQSNNYSVNTMPPSADLSGLTLSSGTLTPAFASGTTDYTSSVGSGVLSVAITASTSDSNATMTVNGNSVVSGRASGTINLNVGSNPITVVVTAENGTTKKTYNVIVNRASSGGGSNNDDSTPPTSPSDSTVISLDGKLTLPSGKAGKVSLGDAVTISIPAGASGKDLKLTIEKVLDTQNLLKKKDVLASPIYEILKNSQEDFSKPVSLTFAFDPASLKSNQKAAVFYFDEVKKAWVEVGGGKVNGSYITIEVNHFTKFAVFVVGDAASTDTKPDITFTDIAGHWAEVNIKQAVSGGIVTGYPDGTFKPNRTVSRAEFVVMLMNTLKPQGEGTTLTFKDTAKIGAWAQKAVAQAVQAGIIKGYEDGGFRPDAEITHLEMAVILAKALSQSIEANVATGFADDKNIPAWAKGSIAFVKEAGIVQGKGDNEFAPQDHATRAEAVTVLMNMLARMSK
ncbi:Ig-like domain-containing protein [Cohnella silvisoli]|uniref:Ig-like domain-containing protein n=1 Tax=Cohnella silvisoli TaxID=2873699 RepID=A0ABV1L4H9_9BACL|nr:Ig-like domain-containing protein [Cohnella silvisoli]